MKGLKIIPHARLSNENLKEIIKSLHDPKSYTERYNFKCLDNLLKDGEPIHLKDLNKEKLLEPKDKDTDLLVLQNTFIYEIQITKKDISCILLHRDLDKVRKVYSKYIDKIKFDDKIIDYEIPIIDNMSVAEMVTKEHFMFSLKTLHRAIEPLKYILDIKRILKDDEMFIYQVIIEPLNTEWWSSYTQAYKKFKSGTMPKKFQIKPKDIFNIFGNVTLNVALELLYCFEELIFGAAAVNAYFI